MASRLLDFDPETGVESIWHYDAASETTHIESRQTLDERLTMNARDYNDADMSTRRGDLWKVASIPLVIYEDLVRKGIAQDQERLRRWLNDPDNRAFRTMPGKV